MGRPPFSKSACMTHEPIESRRAGRRVRTATETPAPEVQQMPDQIERTLRSLVGQLPGRVSLPGEDGYAAATAIWAKPVGPMPRAVVRCRTTEDVQSAIRTVRDCGLPLSVRGGGHDSHGVLKSRELDRHFFVFQIRSLSPL